MRSGELRGRPCRASSCREATSWNGVPRSAARAPGASARRRRRRRRRHAPGRELAARGSSRLVALSSTTSTRRPRARRPASARLPATPRLAHDATVNQKVLPPPGGLSTQIVPPISSTSCCEIARPRPVPPYLRVVEPSAWVKAWKSAPRFSGGMPMPVSRDLEAQRDARRPRRSASVDAHRHLAALGELDGVADAGWSAPGAAGRGRRRSASGTSGVDLADELEALVVRRAARAARRRVVDALAQVEVERLELELAGLDLREVEDVVDDRQQRLGRALRRSRAYSRCSAVERRSRAAARSCR